MATVAASAPDKPESRWIEQLFKEEEFQARLQKTVVNLGFKFLALLGVTATAALLWFGKTLMDGAQAVRDDVAAKQTEAVKRLDQSLASFTAAQTKLKEMEGQASAASAKAVEASKDATQQTSLLLAQGNVLTASTRMVTDMTERMQRRLEEKAAALALATAGVQQQASRFQDEQIKLGKDQEKVQQRQAELDRIQDELTTMQKDLEPKVKAAGETLQSLRTLAGDVARYKTMEFVSLRRNSVAEIGLRHVEVKANGEMESPMFHLLFSTRRLRPLDLRLQVNRAQGFLYEDVDTAKTDVVKPTRDSYCICGTPFMFRVENYVQETFMHDFVTLKILDRTESCMPPKLPAGAACPI
jgi:hypothetical protein